MTVLALVFWVIIWVVALSLMATALSLLIDLAALGRGPTQPSTGSVLTAVALMLIGGAGFRYAGRMIVEARHTLT